MNIILRKAVILSLAFSLLALVTVFSGCGTTRGFGRDLGHLGHGIERAAR